MDRKRKNNWPEFVRSLLKKKRTAFTTWVVLHSTQQDDNNLYTSYNSTHTADIQGKGQWRNDQLSSAISSFYTYPSFACAPRPSEESYRGLCCSLPLWNGTIHQVPLISSVVISHQKLLSLRHFQWGLFPFGLHELFNFRQKETKKTLQTHLLLSHQLLQQHTECPDLFGFGADAIYALHDGRHHMIEAGHFWTLRLLVNDSVVT